MENIEKTKSLEYLHGYEDGYEDKGKELRRQRKFTKSLVKKLRWKTSFMVFAYAAIMFVCMLLQTLVLLSIKFEWSWSKYINTSFMLPIDNLTFIWTIICAAYIGIDRAAYCVRSAEMISGQSDIGNPGVLRTVIVLTVGFFFLAVCCNVFVDANFDLVTLSTAVGTSMSLYITGQKALRICKSVNGKRDKTQSSSEEK